MKTVETKIDWTEVRERLADNERALERVLHPDEARIRDEMRKRARRLAARSGADEVETAGERALVIGLRGESYGVAVGALQEISPLRGRTEVPNTPPEVLGTLAHRGELRSLVDLGKLMDLSEAEEPEMGYVLHFRSPYDHTGLRVDEVKEIVSAEAEGEGTAGEEVSGIAARFVRRRTSDGLSLLDLEAVFAHPVFEGTTSVETEVQETKNEGESR